MALRRDPLDELIEELEHAVPPTAITASHLSLPLEDLQWAVGLVLYAKTEEQRAEANRVTKEITTPGYRTRFPSNPWSVSNLETGRRRERGARQ